MLPGFRFLLAAIVLSISLLVFGLGAAALLRTAHEEFAANPTWRAPPETRFASASEPATPAVLAMLRVDLPATEQPKLNDDPATSAAAEPEAAVPSQSPEPEPVTIARATPAPLADDAVKGETPAAAAALPDTPATSISLDASAAPTAADAPVAPTDHVADKPTAISEPKVAAADVSATPAPANAPATITSESESHAAAPETAPEQPSPPAAIDPATIRIATLGGPPVATESPAQAPDAKIDQINKRRLRAQRARARRLAAYRARIAQQPLQQAISDPFGQLQQQPFGTRTR
jgi:hypothetical protein